MEPANEEVHDSAKLHVTGKATYTDDIKLPNDTLHLAFGISTIAKGSIAVSYTHLTLPTKRIV